METSRCVARVDEGGTCTQLDACKAPYWCDYSFATETGTCKLRIAAEATCDPDGFFPCDDRDHVCSEEQAVCAPLPVAGEPCLMVLGGLCVDNAHCGDDGLCHASPGPGEACVAEGPECQGDLECVGGVCTLAPDEACPVTHG
jgi:hypothetical protein